MAGYLLKPVIPGELKEALLKIREKLETEPGTPREEQEPHHSYLVEKALEEIREHYQLGVSLNQVAAALRISPGVSEHGFRQRDRRKFCVLSKAVQD